MKCGFMQNTVPSNINYHEDQKEVPGTDATAVSDLLCGRLKLAAYLVEQKQKKWSNRM